MFLAEKEKKKGSFSGQVLSVHTAETSSKRKDKKKKLSRTRRIFFFFNPFSLVSKLLTQESQNKRENRDVARQIKFSFLRLGRACCLDRLHARLSCIECCSVREKKRRQQHPSSFSSSSLLPCLSRVASFSSTFLFFLLFARPGHSKSSSLLPPSLPVNHHHPTVSIDTSIIHQGQIKNR